MSITAYCLDWHIKKSDAFKDLVVDPLADFAEIMLKAWDGNELPNKPNPDKPLVFCMLPPPDAVLKAKGLKLVWIPMWDQAQGYDQNWWNALPKDMRIVAFSRKIAENAEAAGLRTLRLQYYKSPDDFQPVGWNHGRVLYYWNRVGMAGPSAIEKLCRSLDIDEVLFKPTIDPGIEENKFYELPAKLGKTKVTTIGHLPSRGDFLKLVSRANIVLSPRLSEGVGMVFIEAMARGSTVIAHDAPTMNEYITHGSNGVLINNHYLPAKLRLAKRLGRPTPSYPTEAPFLLNDLQPWDKLAKMNLEELGGAALLDHAKGFTEWQARRREYANFITEW